MQILYTSTLSHRQMVFSLSGGQVEGVDFYMYLGSHLPAWMSLDLWSTKHTARKPIPNYGLTIRPPIIPLFTWRQIDNPAVVMLSQIICNKRSITYKITHGQLVETPMMVEALLQSAKHHQLDSNHDNPQSNNVASADHACKPFQKPWHHTPWDHEYGNLGLWKFHNM